MAAVVKRCSKCGRTSKVRPRTRRCKLMEQVSGFAKPKYLCYGALVKVERAKRARTTQDELAHAHTKMTEALTRMKRAMTSVNTWQTTIKRLEKKIEAQHAEQRAAIDANASYVIPRKITLPPE